jgi:hypothetical protein
VLRRNFPALAIAAGGVLALAGTFAWGYLTVVCWGWT